MRRCLKNCGYKKIPLLICMGLACWVTTVFFIMLSHNIDKEWLIGVSIYITMSTFCFWLFYYYSNQEFREQESLRLNNIYPRGKKSKYKKLIRSVFFSYCLTGICFLLFLIGGEDTVLWLVMALTIASIINFSLRYYFFVNRYLTQGVKSIFRSMLLLIYSVGVFLTKISSGAFVIEYMDVSSTEIPNLTWCIALIFSIPYSILFFYFSSTVFMSYVIDKIRYRKVILNKMFLPQYGLIGIFVLVGFIITERAGFIITELVKTFYSFDTRSTFLCNGEYQTLFPFDDKARYLALGDGNYRLFYLKGEDFYVAALKCTASNINWYEIKTRKDLDKAYNKLLQHD